MSEEQRQLEVYIQDKLRARGFSDKRRLNNRGIVNATIEEMVLLVGIGSLGIKLK